MTSSRWTSPRLLALAGVTAILVAAALPASATEGDEPGDTGATSTATVVEAPEAPAMAGATAEPTVTPEPTASEQSAEEPAEPPVPTEVMTVEGTLVNLAVEPAGDAHDGASGEDFVVETVVEVDGTFYALPDDAQVEQGVTGQAVEVALAADADLAPVEALAIATADAPAPGEAEPTAETAGPTDVPAGEAEVLAVTTSGDPAAAAEVLAEGAIGSHTLTVLPVYWTAQDSQTTSSLASLATQTAQYWSEQSAGRISMTTSVRPWARIADPGSCNTPQILNSALAANGLGAPGGNTHVLVYFPQMAACGGWAGLASIGGGSIWVNGAPIVDVFAHEFGHNLGLGHANTATCTSGGSRVPLASLSSCTIREYADTADVMGYAIAGRASGNLNTALADHLGLVTVVRPTTSSPVTVDLAPLASTTATRSVAIPVSGGTVYVDFRPATGRDVRQTAWAGVQVHLRTTDPTYRYPTSYLLDMKAPAGTAFGSPAFPVGGSWSIPGTGLTLTVESVGASARLRVSAGSSAVSPGTSALQSYIERVYRDLFSRSVDPSGLQTWMTALQTGTPRVAVANAITYSTEYRSGLIAGSYRQYLGREPEPAGLAHWLTMMAQGMTIQEMEGGFLASAEYYVNAGNTDAGWVTRLYRHVLGRDPGGSEVAHWTQALASGHSRYAVSMGFLLSTEYLTSVVDGYYVDLLGRHIDPSGRATWVSLIQTGTRVEAIIGGVIASDEYYNKS